MKNNTISIKSDKTIISIICIILFIIGLGISSGKIKLPIFHHSEPKFHTTYYMNSQKSLNKINQINKGKKRLKVDYNNRHLYTGSKDDNELLKNSQIITYRTFPYRYGLKIMHVGRTNSKGQYKVYWMESHKLLIRTKNLYNNQGSFSINPLGSEYSTFNEHNLNHQGYFILSKHHNPQFNRELRILYKKKPQIFSKSN